jgi:SAM-dependent methyltransferase
MYKLKFTGDCDEATFKSACAKHEFWYHSYYFDNGFEVRGAYNIGKDIEEYGFPDDMSDMKVLDIGTGGGWFAFYFEQHGAEVTTVDVRGYCDFDVRGRYNYPPVESEKPVPDRIGPDGEPIYFSPVSGAFWIMRDLLKSRVKYMNARVYDLQPDLFDGQSFDLVFMGALLLHLRDPIGALMAARSVCADQLITTTRIMVKDGDNPHPRMDLPWTRDNTISWWRPNKACYKHWFLAAGFRQVDVERTVTLMADKPMSHNSMQILQIGDARICGDSLIDEAPDQPRLGKRIYLGIGDWLIRAGLGGPIQRALGEHLIGRVRNIFFRASYED